MPTKQLRKKTECRQGYFQQLTMDVLQEDLQFADTGYDHKNVLQNRSAGIQQNTGISAHIPPIAAYTGNKGSWK